MLEYALLILALYYGVIVVCTAALARLATRPVDDAFRPTVSVIIAARNEEANLGRCLDAVSRLTYPADSLEVILVDDRSADRTHQIAEEYAARLPFLKVVQAVQGEGMVVGKVNAVAQGVDVARGDILFFTDADCAVPPGWIERTVRYYADDRVGLVAGFTLLEGGGWFGAIQAIDWLALFTVAAGSIKAGRPITAVGTNLTARRRAYEEVGGFRGIPFSVTEDYALFRAITGPGGWQARFPLDPGTLVHSLPCDSVKALYRQKKRWFMGGRGMDAVTLAMFAGMYAFHAAIPVSIAAGVLVPALLAFGAKVVCDTILASVPLVRFRAVRLLPFVPLFEVYFYLYVLLFPLLVMFGGRVIWKERAFRH